MPSRLRHFLSAVVASLRRCTHPVGLLVGIVIHPLSGHTTYLRPMAYEPDAGEIVDILVYHGTFGESLQSIVVEVIEDIKGHGPSGMYAIDRETWQSREPGSGTWQRWNKLKSRMGGRDLRRTSTLKWSSGEEGIHIIGAEVKPSRIALDEQKFQEYLEEVGLENEPIRKFKPENPEGIFTEIFIKTAKTIIQNGDSDAGKVTQPIGLSSEIVPLKNPFEIEDGESLTLQLLLRGRPLANQIVLAGKGLRGSAERFSYRSDANGRVTLPVKDDGEWWVAFNHMQIARPGQEYDLLTHWTTLTFEIDR